MHIVRQNIGKYCLDIDRRTARARKVGRYTGIHPLPDRKRYVYMQASNIVSLLELEDNNLCGDITTVEK